MTKVVAIMSMSLDGYVADANDGVAEVFDWYISTPPREYAKRTYNVVQYTRFDRGGHFAPHEEPDLLAADIHAFAKTLD